MEQKRVKTPAPLASVTRVARPALAVALSRSLQETKSELDQRRLQHSFDQQAIADLENTIREQQGCLQGRDAELQTQREELEAKERLIALEKEKAASAHAKMIELEEEVWS